MKKQLTTILAVFLLFTVGTAYAQEDEFGMGALLSLEPKAEANPLASGFADFPAYFNWNDEGFITPVKNQGSCGSCWAFGILAVMEAQIMIQLDNPDLGIDLSEQDLVSCFDTGASYGGCKGNYLHNTCNYLKSSGVAEEDCFKYVAYEKSCSLKCNEPQMLHLETWNFLQYTYTHKVRWRYSNGVTLSYTLPIPSVETIKAAVQEGPVVTTMAVFSDFYYYRSGVYSPNGSASFQGLHAIAIVGWDDSDSSWICKNSWGTGWGDNGYFKIRWIEGNLDEQANGTYNTSAIIGYDTIQMLADITPLDPNTAPTAAFTAAPASAGTLSRYTFDASDSSDEEDLTEDLEVRWDFNGDGSWDTSFSTEKTTTYEYAADGTYTVTLEVKDTRGSTSTASQQVEAVMNEAPTADFSFTPNYADIKTDITLDASGCSDTEDNASSLQVRWDFESDGVWDTEFTTEKTTHHRFSTEGIYTITLEVRDSAGLSSTSSQNITVHNECVLFDLIEGRTEDPSRVYLFFSLRGCNGEPKDGLDADDFEIYEDDEYISEYESDQTILPSPKLYTMSTVMLLDVSGSILGADALPTVKSSAKAFIDAVSGENGQEVAIYLFDGRADLIPVASFTKDKNALNAAVDGLTSADITGDAAYDKSTNLNGAVKKGLSALDTRRSSIDSEALFTGSLVVFTDGTDRADRVSDGAAVSAVQTSDHTVFSIGLGGEVEENHLENLGKDGFVWADNVAELNNSFTSIAADIDKESKKYYVLGYCSPKRSGSHTVTLKAADYEGELDYAFSAQGFGPGCTPQAIESILYETENVQETGGCYEADFSVSAASGTAPLTVQFQDASVESTSGYFWDFGDGSKSYEQNPSHTYTEPGTYTVVLTIDGYECTREDVITVTTPVSAQTCQAEYALAGRADSKDTLAALRSFRDNVLAKTPLGSMVTRLYYRHTDEIIALMQADPALKDAVAVSIEALLPQVNALQAGEPVELNAEDTASIYSVLQGLEQRSGVLLKGTLMVVRKLLYNESAVNILTAH